MKCEICGNFYKNEFSLSRHIRSHQISVKDYYDKFLLSDKQNLCKICGKLTKFRGIKIGYALYCSCKCSSNSNDKKEKIRKTCINKYGVDNPFKNKMVQLKYQQTCLNRYGVNQVLSSKQIQNKKEQTCLKNNGVLYPAQNSNISKKQQIKIKISNIKSGKWLSDQQISEFRLYQRKVNHYTYQSIKSKFNSNELFNRCKAGQQTDGIQIDHKYSILKGFLNNIQPEIIGSQCNLQILKWKENISKNSKCSITKEQLLIEYEKEKFMKKNEEKKKEKKTKENKNSVDESILEKHNAPKNAKIIME